MVAFVTEDPEKARKLGKEYNVVKTASYDELLRSGFIDAVYIAWPNNLIEAEKPWNFLHFYAKVARPNRSD